MEFIFECLGDLQEILSGMAALAHRGASSVEHRCNLIVDESETIEGDGRKHPGFHDGPQTRIGEETSTADARYLGNCIEKGIGRADSLDDDWFFIHFAYGLEWVFLGILRDWTVGVYRDCEIFAAVGFVVASKVRLILMLWFPV